MEINIGIDLLRFERMKYSLEDPKYIRGVFTQGEIERLDNENSRVRYFSKLLACKEAVFKSLAIKDTFLRSWTEIEIIAQYACAPKVILSEELEKRIVLDDYHISLSLSYETDIVCASALFVNKGGAECH